MQSDPFSLDLSLHRLGASYQLELSHRDPTSQAQVAPVRGLASFDLAELLAVESSESNYGKALARQLFADTKLEQRFIQVETAAQTKGAGLRLSLCIDPSAQELQALRWELLRHPKTGARLTTSETLLLSRFMVSHDWRPVRLRAKAELRALIVVSAPTPAKLARMKLAPVDFEAEVGAVKRALAGVKVDVLGGPNSPVTLAAVLEALRDGVDIVYLVSHGMFGRSSGTPALIFQDEAGDAKVVKGEDLCERVGELQRLPRLIVLASCQSAGDGGQLHPAQRTSAQATLAGRLADAGVPALVAMQGFISMATIEAMMPAFFQELLRDGRIDRALAVARGQVRERDDAWMPALYTRLIGGRLWYEAGFAGGADEAVWRRLIKPVQHGKVLPIIGPHLLEGVHGGSHDTAERLAGQSRFPLAPHDRSDLPRVTEYMKVMESRFNVIRAYQDQLLTNLIEQHRSWLPPRELPPQTQQPKLGKLLALVGDHQREQDPADPHRLLAELPAAFYVTTTFDPLLERALKANDRPPQQVLTCWRYQSPAQTVDEDRLPRPSAKAPMVYHAFGAFGANTDDGLVLTEDDLFDYLIQAHSAQLMPAMVESALVDNSLLLLGFRLTDWHFRVLFRLMMSLPGRERLKQYCHVAVQVDPDLQRMSDVEGTKRYLAAYFGQEANIDIFWGSSAEFLRALHDELQAAGAANDQDQDQDQGDEWNF